MSESKPTPQHVEGRSGDHGATPLFSKDNQNYEDNIAEHEPHEYHSNENRNISLNAESIELELNNNPQSDGVISDRCVDDQAAAESGSKDTDYRAQSRYTKEKGPQIHLPGFDSSISNEDEKEGKRGESVEQDEKHDVEGHDTQADQEKRENVDEKETASYNTDVQQTTEGRSKDIGATKNEESVKESKKEALLKLKSARTNDDYETDYQKEMKEGYAKAEKEYTYFWKTHEVFSQWHPSKFTVGSNTFTCAEQYMMYQKAILFGSDRIAKKILNTTEPRTMKALGRQVSQFKDNVWVWHCLGVVRDGSMHKFTQNLALKEALYSTYPSILAEASPYDKIWGIGLERRDQRAWDESTWEGLNLLGYILTEVRDELMYLDRIITAESRRIYLSDLEAKLFQRNVDMNPGTSVDGDWDMW